MALVLLLSLAVNDLPADRDSNNSPVEVQLDRETLVPVKDRTRGIRREENDAYFQVLEHAERTDYGRQQAQARNNLTEFERRFLENQQQAIAENPQQPRYRYSLYADLLKHPQQYRGELLSLRGHIRRLEEMPLTDGEREMGTAYQAYLFTEDSRTHPYILVCRHVPQEMPRGGGLIEEVSITGYFFKIYAYDAQDAARVAPLVLAQRLEWLPRQATQPLIDPLIGALAVTFVLLILFVGIWRISSRDRRAMQASRQKLAGQTGPIQFDLADESPADQTDDDSTSST